MTMVIARSEPLQIWAGLECTINRVGNSWSDQARLSGHDRRGIRDLEAIADLGIKTLRYPVLWETHARDDVNWKQTDERLDFLHGSGIEVIAGLLHHGSGPASTSLLDPEFPVKFAHYARQVAHRYPWLQMYTPINEPLTTARFSGLYGIWFPHGRDDATFARALYNQIRGIILAMREIRALNPTARLVQTEDLGRAAGTPAAQPQVEHENDRRWLTLDLLTGRVTRQHPLYDYLTHHGRLTQRELRWLEKNRCPPDIIGVNHYLLSNRFLDDRTELYPAHLPRGRINGIEYVDVPALETARTQPPSLTDILNDLWQQYPDIPFAITEAHIDGDDHQRQRWLWEAWNAAHELRRHGAPLVAVTAWSLLGSFDWNTLCTSTGDQDRHYEPGVFDVRTGHPEPTLVADMLVALATTGTHHHPRLAEAGYWSTDRRLKYPPAAGQPIISPVHAAVTAPAKTHPARRFHDIEAAAVDVSSVR